MKSAKGFTLIEILVVVAIIAILAGVVVTTSSTARTKAADNTIKGALVTAANQAEIFYGLNNTYGTYAQATCPSATGGAANMFQNDSRLLDIIKQGWNSGGNGSSCVSNGEAYAIAIGLKTSGETLCIDNTKIVRQTTGTPSAAITGTSCN